MWQIGQIISWVARTKNIAHLADEFTAHDPDENHSGTCLRKRSCDRDADQPANQIADDLALNSRTSRTRRRKTPTALRSCALALTCAKAIGIASCRDESGWIPLENWVGIRVRVKVHAALQSYWIALLVPSDDRIVIPVVVVVGCSLRVVVLAGKRVSDSQSGVWGDSTENAIVSALLPGETMPDSSGRLTQEDVQKLQAWWNKTWKEPVICPVCKTSTWSTAAHVVQMYRLATDAGVTGSASYQFIAVSCTTCSHTMLFNSVSMGITPPFKPDAGKVG